MPPRVGVTLQDVADRARVHRSTVALALRDHPRIAVATRERVKAIANRLGYRVNPLVAALIHSRRSGSSVCHQTIAYVTNYDTRFGWRQEHHNRPDFFPGAQLRAREFGYNLEHFWFSEPGLTAARFREVLLTRGIAGLIVGRMPADRQTLELDWDSFSAVALGLTLRSPRLHHVTENHFETACTAMAECRARGYRRVGFVFSEANDSPRVGDRWLGAYLQQQSQFAPADRLPICPGMPADRSGFLDWYKRHRPDALLVTHRASPLSWLKSMGHDVPRDVGMVELQDTAEETVSGVSYDAGKIGALAVEMLIGLMYRNETGVPVTPHEVMLSGTWREGVTLPRRHQARVSRRP